MIRPGRAIKGFLAAAPAAEERAPMPSMSGGDERVRGDVPLVPAVVVEGYLGTIALHGHRVPAVGLTGSSVSDAQIRRRQEHCPALRCVAVGLDGTNRDARPSSSPHRWQSTG